VRLLIRADHLDPSLFAFPKHPISKQIFNVRVVKLLLADSTDWDSKRNYGQTPLSRAVVEGHEAVVKLLLAKNGIDPNSKDPLGG
jgi:ankyrin repeat protein